MEQKMAKGTQEDPKIDPVSPKIAQSEPQDGPRSPPEDPIWTHLNCNETRSSEYPVIMEDRVPKEAQEVPKMAQVSPKIAQSEPQHDPSEPSKGPHMDPFQMQRNSCERVSGHNGRQGAQGGPGRPQDGPSEPQDGPK